HATGSTPPVLALPIAVVGATLRALAVASTSLPHRRPAHHRAAQRRAVALATVAAPAHEEHLPALGAMADHVAQRLSEGLCHRFARNWTSRSGRASSSPLGGKRVGSGPCARTLFSWLVLTFAVADRRPDRDFHATSGADPRGRFSALPHGGRQARAGRPARGGSARGCTSAGVPPASASSRPGRRSDDGRTAPCGGW